MTGKRLIVLLAVLCLSAVAASAEWPRTVSAIDTRTPAAEKLQAEVGGVHMDGEDWEGMGLSLLARYGVADNWAVLLNPTFVSYDVDGGDSESGIGDTEIGTIYRFLDETKDSVDLAAGVFVSLPTGDDDKSLGSGSVEPGLGIALAKTLGPIVAVGNLGYTFIMDADEGEEDGFASAALEAVYPVDEKMSVNAFVDAEMARVEDADDDVSAGIGARFLPKENMLWKALVATGLTDEAADLTVGVSFGYEF